MAERGAGHEQSHSKIPGAMVSTRMPLRGEVARDRQRHAGDTGPWMRIRCLSNLSVKSGNRGGADNHTRSPSAVRPAWTSHRRKPDHVERPDQVDGMTRANDSSLCGPSCQRFFPGCDSRALMSRAAPRRLRRGDYGFSRPASARHVATDETSTAAELFRQ